LAIWEAVSKSATGKLFLPINDFLLSSEVLFALKLLIFMGELP